MAAKSYKSVILLVFLTCVNIQVQFFQLFGVQYRRCVKHHIAAAIVLREGNAIAYRVETCHDRNKAVKTEGQTSVRRCSILEGVDEEAKL